MLGIDDWLRRRREMRQLDRQLPDALMQIAVALRAGGAFSQILNQIAIKGKGPLAEEFTRVNKEIQEGRPQEEALNAMVKRVGHRDLELAVMAINVHSRAGGNLSEALVSIAERVRDRVRLRDEIQTLTTTTRYSAYFLTLIPIGLAVLLFFIEPNYFRPFLQSQLGGFLLTLGAALLIVGNFIMYRMGEIKV
jgi:tight adherence protein B